MTALPCSDCSVSSDRVVTLIAHSRSQRYLIAKDRHPLPCLYGWQHGATIDWPRERAVEWPAIQRLDPL
ncbi:hypothetical protein ACN4EK_13135 [Pantanalinema rosaneae CENA516]|uniref:hypothetical protein n=1 Tax=Pantanalinema rosaneae TaxID=1620701 RepID=UPI003D6F331B